MTESRLLKSWATPPASRPTASIFWAWRNSRCFCSRARACSRRARASATSRSTTAASRNRRSFTRKSLAPAFMSPAACSSPMKPLTTTKGMSRPEDRTIRRASLPSKPCIA